MYYSSLGSSFGGCGVPSDRERFTVSDPTANSSTRFPYASGSNQGGWYYSPSSCPAADLLANCKK